MSRELEQLWSVQESFSFVVQIHRKNKMKKNAEFNSFEPMPHLWMQKEQDIQTHTEIFLM